MDYLKAKVDAGADMIISQMFYDADKFLDWVKECRAAGITIPIVPGVLPIQNYAGFRKMTGFCKTYIPRELEEEVMRMKPDESLEGEEKAKAEEAFKEWGVKQLTDMCKKLIDGGVTQLHFYTLNLDKATTQVLKNLGFIPEDYSDETCEKYKEEAKEHRGFVTVSSTD
eukprot:Sspe_Gene.1555::Locus_515_Transcript_1_1_Confidence_1.000_Length_1391::g.1555::m.1555/K00297/metF, MTHFR; methylenetetrahydrofolate reductase (NADPH)